jgi:putative PIN family toxin of toxin-antitoxin system
VRIVCDTNVLVSAIVFGGRPREVLETVIAGRTQGFLSAALEQEFREVLIRPKFGLSQRHVHHICQALRDLLQTVYPKEKISAIKEDPADNAVLACALAAGADCIISGDAHLLKLGRFRNIRILRPSEFLDNLAV